MTSTEVLHQLKDLKEAWKKQNFVYSSTQQIKYNNLVEKRRDNSQASAKNRGGGETSKSKSPKKKKRAKLKPKKKKKSKSEL